MWRALIAAVALVIFFVTAEAPARTWTSASGAVQFEAELIEKKVDGTLVLKRSDGTTIETKAEKFSAADQQYIRAWKPPAPATKGDDLAAPDPVGTIDEVRERDADKRWAVPAKEEIAKNQKLVKELLADDYAKNKPAGRAELAAKLLKQAGETKEDRAGLYVLLCEARDIGAKAGDPLTASRAAEDLASQFQVTAGEAREPLAALAASSMTPANADTAANILLTAADAATNGECWDAAQSLLKAAETTARKAKSLPLVSQAKARSLQLEKTKVEAAKVKDSMAKLKTDPSDPAANLAVGRFLCMVKHDWEAALPMLAKGANGALKKAVDQDQQATNGDSAAQLAAADAWYDLAAAAPADSKSGLQLRAHHWYVLAFPKATGLGKTKAEKRIKELQSVAERGTAGKSKIWMNIRKGLADKQLKRWPTVGGAFAQKQFEEIPPGGALLVGFRYTTIGGGNYPGVVQPIYQTAAGEVLGKVYGMPERGAVAQVVKAKPGYAVGAIYARGGGGFDAFKPIFMRIKDKGLDIEDSYEGPHIGGKGGGEGTSGGDGSFIVGVHGKIGDQGKMEAMSAVTLSSEREEKK